MIDICFSIGSNISDRSAHLDRAVELMRDRIGNMVKRSSLYETSSWGFDSEHFLNGVVLMRTDLSPLDCFEEAQRIEQEMGRGRKGEGYVDRVIDLDILSYGNRSFDTKLLTIPHPRLAERRFVLEPWAEICSEMIVAGTGMTVEMLKNACKDKGGCVKLEYV